MKREGYIKGIIGHNGGDYKGKTVDFLHNHPAPLGHPSKGGEFGFRKAEKIGVMQKV